MALDEIYERAGSDRKAGSDSMRYPPAEAPEDYARAAANRDLMSWALLSLTEREREAVLLRYYVRCDIAEIAMIMDDIKPATAERYAVNGHGKLARVFTGGDPDAGSADGCS